jgi:hypothetical protein
MLQLHQKVPKDRHFSRRTEGAGGNFSDKFSDKRCQRFAPLT